MNEYGLRLKNSVKCVSAINQSTGKFTMLDLYLRRITFRVLGSTAHNAHSSVNY